MDMLFLLGSRSTIMIVVVYIFKTEGLMLKLVHYYYYYYQYYYYYYLIRNSLVSLQSRQYSIFNIAIPVISQ